MQNKVKWQKVCPADYNNAEQTDSDHPDDPDYRCQEQASPKISQDKGCPTYRKRQEDKKGTPKRKKGGQTSTSTPKHIKGGQTSPGTPLSPASQVSDTGKRRCNRALNFQSKLAAMNQAKKELQQQKAKKARKANIFVEVEQIEERLQANRNRITPRLQPEEDDEITRAPRPYNRKSRSIIWNHCKKEMSGQQEELLLCNYCPKNWKCQRGSTSNPLKHLREMHYNRLSDEEKAGLPKDGATSGNNSVKRTLNKTIKERGTLPRSHPEVEEIDRKIAKVILTTCASWRLMENKAFAELCNQLLGGRYNIPSRYYIQENVITPMYEETKCHIINELKKQVNIGLTTDAWTSLTQQSYITVTAHIINEAMEFKSYVLDTTEITNRHTSENLMNHIEKILSQYKINTNNKLNIIYNFNATNPDNVHELDQEEDHEVNYLHNDSELTHVVEINEENVIDSQSQTQNIFLEENLDEIYSLSRNSLQNSLNSLDLQLSEIERTPPSGSTTPHNLTFVSDNASDINKALSGIGGYERFGCAAHHLNLVGQAGFKQVKAAANLVKRCKRVVEHIRSSTPASYLLIEYQKEFEMPLLKVLQENNTR